MFSVLSSSELLFFFCFFLFPLSLTHTLHQLQAQTPYHPSGNVNHRSYTFCDADASCRQTPSAQCTPGGLKPDPQPCHLFLRSAPVSLLNQTGILICDKRRPNLTRLIWDEMQRAGSGLSTLTFVKFSALFC